MRNESHGATDEHGTSEEEAPASDERLASDIRSEHVDWHHNVPADGVVLEDPFPHIKHVMAVVGK